MSIYTLKLRDIPYLATVVFDSLSFMHYLNSAKLIINSLSDSCLIIQ